MTKHVSKETNITNSILDYLNSLPRCYARKRYQNIYQRNIPDIDCGIHGWYYMFEVKRPGETSTPAQQAEQAKARKGGIRVYEVHSKDEVKAIMVADGWDDLPTRGSGMINTKLIDTILKNLDLVRELKQEYSRSPEGRRKSTDVILLDSHGSGKKPDYPAILNSLVYQLDKGIKKLPSELNLIFVRRYCMNWALEDIRSSLYYPNIQMVHRRIAKLRDHFRDYFIEADLDDWEWQWVIERIFIMQEKKKPRC